MYDLVVEARSNESNGVRTRHGGRYGDSAGLAIGEGQAGACRFRRRADDLGCRDIRAERRLEPAKTAHALGDLGRHSLHVEVEQHKCRIAGAIDEILAGARNDAGALFAVQLALGYYCDGVGQIRTQRAENAARTLTEELYTLAERNKFPWQLSDAIFFRGWLAALAG